MTRRAGAALVGLGAYGVTMVAVGVSLALAAPHAPAATVILDDGTRPQVAGLGVDPDPAAQAAPSGALAATASSTAPSTTRATQDARRATAAAGQRETFAPTRIVLPSGRTAPVSPSGVQPDGSLVIPDRPDRVGWWDGGARAGDPLGSLVIAGHVDSRTYGLGVLAELKWAEPGDVIELRSAGLRERYRIYRAVQVDQQSLASDDEFFRQDVAHRLVVITCGGPFDRERHRYLDNYVVLAAPVV